MLKLNTSMKEPLEEDTWSNSSSTASNGETANEKHVETIDIDLCRTNIVVERTLYHSPQAFSSTTSSNRIMPDEG